MNSHLQYLKQALELAKLRQGYCAPNPSVGAVIVKSGRVVAEGYHLAAGAPHAEAAALQNATGDLTDAVMYVTLEPCSHWGRTPPCTEAIIRAGIKQVFYGYGDPNPTVTGNGAALLAKAGIVCEQLMTPEIEVFYQSYRHWLTTQTPFVTVKLAMTLDGKIASTTKHPIKITSPELDQFTHAMRKASDAILTTSETIIQDDPQLNARIDSDIIAKPIYVLDTQLRLPLTAKILKSAKNLTVFHSKRAAASNRVQLEAHGVQCVPVPDSEAGLELSAILKAIGKYGVHALWVEAGAKCFNALLQQKLANKALLYVAPWILGEGYPAFSQGVDLRGTNLTFRSVGKEVIYEVDVLN